MGQKAANSHVKKLNYLLVMPRLVRNVNDSYSFPLGIAYISSSLKKAGFNVFTLNLNHCEGQLYDILKDKIEKNGIHVVLTGALSAQYNSVRSILEITKRIDESLITVVGGGIISSSPIVAMDALEYVDFGVIGEGEVTSVELCHVLENGGEFAAIDGLVFNANNRICSNSLINSPEKTVTSCDNYVLTSRRKEIEDIDSIPWPDYAGFELEKTLASTLGLFGFNESNTLAMVSSRSCPYNCTFCFHTVGLKYRQRSLDGFFEELDYLVSNYNIKGLYLSDELCARDISRLEQFCSRVKQYNIKWCGSFRVDDVTPEMLTVLKNGNCVLMMFGLESADNRILKSMRKGITIEQTEKALKLVHDKGISMTGCFIFGDIEETLETATKTLNWWKRHPEYGISLRLIVPYPGTYVYKIACENAIIRDQVKFLKDGCPQVNISKMSDQEFRGFAKELMEASAIEKALLSSVVVHNINSKHGCIDVDADCSVCGAKNNWKKVRLFKLTHISCFKCGQQYIPPLDSQIYANIDKNIQSLVHDHGKLAVWGMSHFAIEILSNSQVLQAENIFYIDICTTKQNTKLYGKTINSPDIIAKEYIETVVVSAPYNLVDIEAHIEINFKNVKRVIDVSNLIGFD